MNCHILELASRPRYGMDLVKSLDALGFHPSIYPAVDGRNAAAADLPVVHPYRFEKRYGRKPVPGEIGCFASHRKFCIEALAGKVCPVSDSYPDWWFLLEDDALVHGGMNAEFLMSMVKRADAAAMDYVFLHPGRLSRRKRLAPGLGVGGRGEIFTHAALIHRRAAESISAWEMFDPIDLAISRNRWFSIGVLNGPDTFVQQPRKEEVEAIHFEKRRSHLVKPKPSDGVIVADCRCSQKRGLGNLMTVVCSAYAAAKVRGWEMVIWWERTTHCGAYWEELFELIPGIDVVRRRPASGHFHTGAYYDAKTRVIHRASAGPGRHTQAYWDAWREIGPMIRLIPELALPEVPVFDAVSVRLAHPPQTITDAWAKALPDIKAPFLAVDCREAFDIARRRFPDAWWLCDRFQPSDAAPRNLDHIRDAARDMMMLTRASRVFAVGRESTFRNLAHLGYGVPVLKPYAGPAP